MMVSIFKPVDMLKKFTLFLFVALLPFAARLHAQLKGLNIPGDVGLQSGTQGPAGFNILVPVYFYAADKLKDGHGDLLSNDPGINMFFTGIGANWVLPQKILGGHLGGTVLIPFTSNRVSSNIVDEKSTFSFTDMYFQPVQLGWKLKQADITAGYALFFPTGKFELGGENSGLGMLVNEFSGGTTLYLNKKKTTHFSTLLSYDIHSKKRGTDIRTGDILTIEGGLGRTWYKEAKGPVPVIINAGVVYYAQYKITEDNVHGEGISIGDHKDHVYGLGPEGNVFVPRIRTQFALRWLAEFDAVNRFQGFTTMLTIAYNVKSFKEK